jgi:hypothetical protein|tara:strand:- start:26 stop:265 length:240 start_codon:yes stop_codon:yes gene_type:complete
MADDETPEPPAPPVTIDLPDIRVVSVFHDADKDRLGVVHDDDLDPHHALGLLLHGLWVQLQSVETFDFEFADDDPDEDS